MPTLFAISAILLAYTWLGYPLLIWALSRARGHKGQGTREPGTPMVTVVLATREGDAAIAERIADLLGGSWPAECLSVVVALDARRDPPAVYLPLPSAATVVRGDAPGGKAAALNAGVRAARGEVLVFADTAQRFHPHAIRILTDALVHDDALGAVSGALEIPVADGRHTLAERYWMYERWLRENESRSGSVVGVTGAVYAMRRALWEPLPVNLILDDVYVPMRLALRGFRIGFRRDAVATDVRRFAARDEYRRKARTLTGNLQLCAWLPAVLLPLRNPIWFRFVSHKLLRLATPYLALVLVVAGLVLASGLVPPDRMGTAWIAALGVGAGALLVGRFRHAVWSAVLLQTAAVKATLNALRGDWDVWRS